MPGCISAFIKESRGILTAVRSFSQLRGISAQTEVSCIRAATELSVTTKPYFSAPYKFYSKFHKDEVLDKVTLILSQLPADAQYTLQKKLELAKELLIHTSKSISDIAAAVGYNNLSSFSYMFKHETGMTPMAYRRTPNTSC